jgi:hypothetical protein
MPTIAKSSVLIAGLCVSFLPGIGDTAAKDQQYLLNCRLMDSADPLYERFCTGDKAAGKIVCRGSYCLLITTNYNSRYSGQNEALFVVGDGPSRGDIPQRTVATSAAPGSDPAGAPPSDTPGGTPPTDTPDGTPRSDTPDRSTPQSSRVE